MKKNIFKILSIFLILSTFGYCVIAQSGYTPGPSTVYVCDIDEGVRLGGRGGDEYCFRWEPDEDLSVNDVRNPRAKPSSDKDYTVTVLDNELNIIDQQVVHVIVNPEARLKDIIVDSVVCCIKGKTKYNQANLKITTDPPNLEGTLLYEPSTAPNPSYYDVNAFGTLLDEPIKIVATCKNDDDELMEKTVKVDIVNENYKVSVENGKFKKAGYIDVDKIFEKVKELSEEVEKATDLPVKEDKCKFKIDTSRKVTLTLSPECCPGYEGPSGSCIYTKTKVSASGTLGLKLENCEFPYPIAPDGGLISQFLFEVGITLSAGVGVNLNAFLEWSCAHQSPEACFDLSPYITAGIGVYAQALKGFGKVSASATAKITAPLIHYCAYNTSGNGTLTGEFCLEVTGNFTVTALWGGITITSYTETLYESCKDYF
jgi:hypothetical protein